MEILKKIKCFLLGHKYKYEEFYLGDDLLRSYQFYKTYFGRCSNCKKWNTRLKRHIENTDRLNIWQKQ
jgi:hypothetical protein